MDNYRLGLLKVARRLLYSQADAEDAVQDTYVRALVMLSDGQTPQPGWLHTVLRNIAIDRRRHQRLESLYADALHVVDESLAPPPEESRSDCEAAIRHLLGRLSAAEAGAIVLRDVFEFDYDEIAEVLGKHAAACRQLLHRARRRSREINASSEADEPFVALCGRAIETRDPMPLMEFLHTITVQSGLGSMSANSPAGNPRSSTRLLQVNGRYVIALVLDGVVLCVVPVGLQTAGIAGQA